VSLLKQAKMYSPAQHKMILSYLDTTRDPVRNRALFLMSTKLGLRACEIAAICWNNVLNDYNNAVGDTVRITNDFAKGAAGGREFYMGDEVKAALQRLYEETVGAYVEHQNFYFEPIDHNNFYYDRIILNQFGDGFSANGISRLFYYWFKEVMGIEGFSSHSGRRTFITNCARKVSTVGASLYDVQRMAGHRCLSSTQRYIEENADAQRKLVNLI